MAEQTIFTFIDEVLESNCICCTVCSNILRPPVMLVENIGNMCSECYEEKRKVMNFVSLNNMPMEKILHLLRLPCKYRTKGCNERLPYPELLTHQNECKLRTKLCLMSHLYGCEWEGDSVDRGVDFINHFKECHGDHVVNFENNLFFLETSLNDLNLVKLLVTKRCTFILRMQTNLEKNKLYYMICGVKESHTPFDYSVKHKGSSKNYIKTKSKILPSHNVYNDFDEKLAIEVDLEALKQISNISETITNIFKIKIDDTQLNGIDEKMLHFFECPVCKNCMKPPIYQCQSGHSICNICRPRLEKCPTCRAIFGSTRNYSLEGLTSGVQYPCVYHDLGCTESASATSITRHERECSFKPYNCPFPSCTSSGNHVSIISHLINFHSDSVIYSGCTGYTECFRIDQNSCYNKILDRKCVIAYNHIFRLACKRVAEHCLWAAEIFCCCTESKMFIYEVAIIDIKRPEKKLIKTDYCLSDVTEDEVFKKCIIFPNTLLSSYSNHGMITFSFSIKEKTNL